VDIIPITISLIVVQEMYARMGVVTGKGLSDLIREEFGLRTTFLVMVALVVVNFTNVVTESSALPYSAPLSCIRIISVPVCAALVWFLVFRGDYKARKDILVPRSFTSLHLCRCAFTAKLARSDSGYRAAANDKVWRDKAYIYMPSASWYKPLRVMQFYLQSSVVEKGIRVKDYAASRLDVIVGSFFTDLVACSLSWVCGHALCARHGAIQIASDAQNHAPAGGDYAFLLFAFGLFNASLFAASILPLSTAYTVCEGLASNPGWTRASKKRLSSTGSTRF